MDVDFKTAVFFWRAAQRHFETERAKLIVQIHDDRKGLEAFIARKGEEAESGWQASLEIAEAELHELDETFGRAKQALTARWGAVFE